MVTPRFAPLVGGTETHVMEVATRLALRGVQVTVLTIGAASSGGGPPVRSERINGFEVRRFDARIPGGFSWQLQRSLRAEGRHAYDVVHVQGVHTALPKLALDAARRAGRPTVLTFHTGGHSNRLLTVARDTQWRLLRRSLRSTDRLVAVCEYEVGFFAERTGLPRDHFAVIRNGAERLGVDDSPPDLHGAPLILSVARLERYKGHHRLIAALPALLERAPAAHLGIIGKGPYEATLRRLAAELGVAHAVSFTSFPAAARDRLGTLLNSADATALLSDYEAHPVAVMEALALGVPTLVADGSGLTELAEQGLVDKISRTAPPVEVAEALLRTAGRPRSTSPVALATWDDAAEELHRVYLEVAGR